MRESTRRSVDREEVDDDEEEEDTSSSPRFDPRLATPHAIVRAVERKEGEIENLRAPRKYPVD